MKLMGLAALALLLGVENQGLASRAKAPMESIRLEFVGSEYCFPSSVYVFEEQHLGKRLIKRKHIVRSSNEHHTAYLRLPSPHVKVRNLTDCGPFHTLVVTRSNGTQFEVYREEGDKVAGDNFEFKLVD